MTRMNGKLLRLESEEAGPAKHMPLTTVKTACAAFFARRGIHEPTWKEAVGFHITSAKNRRRKRS